MSVSEGHRAPDILLVLNSTVLWDKMHVFLCELRASFLPFVVSKTELAGQPATRAGLAISLPSCRSMQLVLESQSKLKIGIVRKFFPFSFQVPPGLPVWRFRKFPRKRASRKGALCSELAEFRCEGTPFSLSCAVAHGSLVVQREILLKET